MCRPNGEPTSGINALQISTSSASRKHQARSHLTTRNGDGASVARMCWRIPFTPPDRGALNINFTPEGGTAFQATLHCQEPRFISVRLLKMRAISNRSRRLRCFSPAREGLRPSCMGLSGHRNPFFSPAGTMAGYGDTLRFGRFVHPQCCNQSAGATSDHHFQNPSDTAALTLHPQLILSSR